MSKNLRVKTSKYIDETSRISFKFNGKLIMDLKVIHLLLPYLANDIHLVGRSFKYHRPRGIMTAGSEEPMQLFKLMTTQHNRTQCKSN